MGRPLTLVGRGVGLVTGRAKFPSFAALHLYKAFLLLLLYIIIIKKTRAHKNNTTQNEVVFLRDVKKCPTGSNLLKPTPHMETWIQPVDVLFHYPMVNIDAFAFFVVNT